MKKESPYFYIENKFKIVSLKKLLELGNEKLYGRPGKPPEYQNTSDPTSISIYTTHYTSGLFRGQAQAWPLIPSSYRDENLEPDNEISEVVLSFRCHRANQQHKTFSELAKKQNHDFPKSPVEQMVIAQHYGIKTPLLDWTTNIFVAIYFALDLKKEDDLNKNLKPYIYHIKDERLLYLDIDKINNEEGIRLLKESALVNPMPIDRRVERQFSLFTFHPYPLYKPPKIPVTEYRISDKLFLDLWDLMKGMGFSSAHYFPDYSGLAERIKQGYML